MLILFVCAKFVYLDFLESAKRGMLFGLVASGGHFEFFDRGGGRFD